MGSSLVLEPAPLVTRSRKRTVAKAGSITLVVRRCFQCSAGKSKKLTKRSQFAASDSTALGYSAAKRTLAASQSDRRAAYIISCSARLARACKRWATCRAGWQAGDTSSPARESRARRRGRPPRSRVHHHLRPHGCDHAAPLELAQQRLPAFGALAVAVLDRQQFLLPIGTHVDHHQGAEPINLETDIEMYAVDPDIDVFALAQVAAAKVVIFFLPAVRPEKIVGR